MALPLSACPLKHLEIHCGSTQNTYNAASLDGALTATLDAQRSTARNHSNLLLQFHLGLRRIISIQLADSDMTPASEREIVQFHEPSLKISIQIGRTQQTVIFCFEIAQDFNHTIAMLKRIGLRPRDDIPPLLHAVDAIDTTTNFDPEPITTYHPGPRLGSFAALVKEGQHISQSEFSFTKMLNSDIPLTQLLPPRAQNQQLLHSRLYNGSQQLRRQTDPVTRCTSPTYVDVSQPKKIYQPRISSPLRYAVPTNDRSEASNLPISNSQPTSQPMLYIGPAITQTSLDHRSDHSQVSDASFASSDTSLDYQFGPTSSQESMSVESSSQGPHTTDDDFHPQPGQNFRILLPRTRSLPFLQSKNHKIVKSKPRTKQSQRLANSQEKGMIAKNAGIPNEMNIRKTYSNSIDSQFVSHQTPPQSKASQTSHAPTSYHSSPEMANISAMLITDPTLLERANKATSRLFDQYNEDLSRGCNAASCAEFYLEQIHAVRTEFWFNALNQMGKNYSGSESLWY